MQGRLWSCLFSTSSRDLQEPRTRGPSQDDRSSCTLSPDRGTAVCISHLLPSSQRPSLSPRSPPFPFNRQAQRGPRPTADKLRRGDRRPGLSDTGALAVSPARSPSPLSGLNPRPLFQIPRPAGKGGPAEPSKRRPSLSPKFQRRRARGRGGGRRAGRGLGGAPGWVGGEIAAGGREGARARGRGGRGANGGRGRSYRVRGGRASRAGVRLGPSTARVWGRPNESETKRPGAAGGGVARGSLLPLALVRSPELLASPTTRSNARTVPGERPLQNWSPGLHHGRRASPGGKAPWRSWPRTRRACWVKLADSSTTPKPRSRSPGRAPSAPPAALQVTRERALQTGPAQSPSRARGRARSGDFAALDAPVLARGAPPSLLPLLYPVCTSTRASAPVSSIRDPVPQPEGFSPARLSTPICAVGAPTLGKGVCSAPAAAGYLLRAGLLGPAVGLPVGFRCPLLGTPRFACGR